MTDGQVIAGLVTIIGTLTTVIARMWYVQMSHTKEAREVEKSHAEALKEAHDALVAAERRVGEEKAKVQEQWRKSQEALMDRYSDLLVQSNRTLDAMMAREGYEEEDLDED